MTNRFGETLRKYREEAGLPASTLAHKVGISAPYLHHVEKGTYPPPSAEIIAKLEKELAIENIDKGLLFKMALEDGSNRLPRVVIEAAKKADSFGKFLELMEAIANGVQVPWDSLLELVHTGTEKE